MPESYRTVFQSARGRYEEKKSVFLADMCHVEDENEALDYVASVRKKYHDARHHCFAWILGADSALRRSSDDGEPSGTAGRPILDTLAGAELTDTILVVTRYFGGTLLGTGGLARAYQAAASDCVSRSVRVEMVWCARLEMKMNYTDYGKVRYYLDTEKIEAGNPEFTESVFMKVNVPASELASVTEKITGMTAGRVRPECTGYAYVQTGAYPVRH